MTRDNNDEIHPFLKVSLANHESVLLARDSTESDRGLRESTSSPTSSPHKLGQFLATSIAGNDITSSCLYVSGICAYYAGIWAPIALILVSGILLYLFRKIYAEVVTALPVNGGTYTLLLNTTSKTVASLAGCLTMLSYISTAVVSASVGVSYLEELAPQVNQNWGPIVILALFALLTFFGLKDSARVAAGIFTIHLVIMIMLIVDCAIFAVGDRFALLADNFNKRGDVLMDGRTPYGFGYALIFGFGSAMLGITGFETSANYVEEQKPGVFPKTLRNMWICVALLNPILSFLSFSVLDLQTVMGYPLDDGRPNNNDLLVEMARQGWLKKLISADAFLVLSGAVLTSYVGVNGLLRRMAMDECFPKFFLHRNKLFNTYHVIIFGFFLVCSSLYFIVDRNVLILASVYAISFLSVMSLFCIGNLILKYKRSRIRRDYLAHPAIVILALSACIIAIYINIVIDPSTLKYFFLYYGITLLIVALIFQKLRILQMILRGLVGKNEADEAIDSRNFSHIQGIKGKIVRSAKTFMNEMLDQTVVFFIKQPDICLMNKVVAYVRDNESCSNIKFVHICNKKESENAQKCEELFFSDLAILQRIYPKKRLGLAVIQTPHPFDGTMVTELSEELGVPTHKMFISCPSIKFPYDIAMLGGVRLITH
jgi:amino acid transporter